MKPFFPALGIRLLLLLWLTALPALADPLKISPGLSLTQAYDDNILFSQENGEKDFLTTASGKLIIRQKSQRFDLKMEGRLDKVIYLDLSRYNSLDKFFSAQADLRVSQRMTLGGNARYINDSRKDSGLDASGLVVLGDRKTKDLSFTGSYQFTQTSSGLFDLGYGKETIKNDPDKEQNDVFSTTWTLSKDLSQTFANTTGLFSVSYFNGASLNNLYWSNGAPASYKDYTSDVWQIYSGFSKALTQQLSFYVQAGGNYAQIREEAGTGQAALIFENSGFGGILYTGLNFRGETYEVSLDFSHDLKQGSGTNGTVKRSALTLDLDRKLTQRFSATFKTSGFLNKNKRQTSPDLDEQTFIVQPGFRYQIDRGLTLSGMVKTTFIQNRQTSRSTRRNLVYIGISKTFDPFN